MTIHFVALKLPIPINNGLAAIKDGPTIDKRGCIADFLRVG